MLILAIAALVIGITLIEYAMARHERNQQTLRAARRVEPMWAWSPRQDRR
jgi:hypothetical protein